MEPMSAIKDLHVKVRHEDDSLWATVDEFPGVFATGDNLDELRESLEEGISLVARAARRTSPYGDPQAPAAGASGDHSQR